MVLELPAAAGRRERGIHTSALEALKLLPQRRPVDPPAKSSVVRWDLVDFDRYEVHDLDGTLGFIDVVGAVFVVLEGPRHDRAVEVLQTLVFEEALASLRHVDSIRSTDGTDTDARRSA